MKKLIMYVGLDVHKNSIEVAFADAGRDGEVRSYGKIDGNLTALDKVIRKREAKGSELHFAYEAGPCGYGIYRHLSSNGYDCIVVAPSMIPRQSGNRLQTDRRDAQMLARLHRAGELTSIYVPALEDEAMRDRTRAREDAKSVEKKAKQRILAVFPHQAHLEWMGCDMCHPDVFIVKKNGTENLNMAEILKGGFCGKCHLSVAFHLNNCNRCHPGIGSH